MGVELDDTALMLRYKDGDVAAFEKLYGRHRGPLFRFLLRQAGSQELAEDLFQEVWSKIIRNRENYRPTARFTTYMYHIARNCTVDLYRRLGRNREISAADASVPEPVAPTGNPVKIAAAADTARALVDALNSLRAEQREAFLLKEEGGLSLQEIADVTGVGRETVKSRLRYALGALQKSLNSHEAAGADDG